MSQTDAIHGASGAEPPAWQPLSPVQRRVVGVLVEKAKTTPDSYPLTLNALVTGCNQKSNRRPQMQLSADEASQALEQLQQMGAVVEVQSSGRVPKYRHRLYEWLGVDKVELAVMAELLLRGEQTLGELRGRAARMEPIADVAALQPVVRSLIDRGLVVPLTPPGRGQVVTHGLYPPAELDQLRRQIAGGGAPPAVPPAAEPAPAASPADTGGADSERMGRVEQQIQQLRAELEALRQQVAQLVQRLP